MREVVVVVLHVLPFPAESATVNHGGTVCCPLFVVVVWSGVSMIFLLMSIIERNKGNIVM
jgi:hypothetical protein